MPKEQIDIIEEGLNELKADVRGLREQMTKDHQALLERVIRLEHHEKLTRWFFAIGGTAGGFIIRELLGRIV